MAQNLQVTGCRASADVTVHRPLGASNIGTDETSKPSRRSAPVSRALCAMRASRCVRLTAHAAAPPKRSLEAPACGIPCV